MMLEKLLSSQEFDGGRRQANHQYIAIIAWCGRAGIDGKMRIFL
jgi:hypothetical protein